MTSRLDTSQLERRLSALRLAPDNERRLCSELTRGKNFNALVRLWNSQKEYFNPQNISAFLHRFYKCAQVANPQESHIRALNEVLKTCEERLNRFETHSVTLVANSLRHIRPAGAQLFQTISLRFLQDDSLELKMCTCKDLILLADAARAFNERKLLVTACRLISQKLPEATPLGLALISESFVVAEVETFLPILCTHIVANNCLAGMQGWQIAKLVGAVYPFTSISRTLLRWVQTHCQAQPELVKSLDHVDLGLLKDGILSLPKKSKKLLDMIQDELLHKPLLRISSTWLVRALNSFYGLTPCPKAHLDKIKRSVKLEELSTKELALFIRGLSNAEEQDIPFLTQLRKAYLERSDYLDDALLVWAFSGPWQAGCWIEAAKACLELAKKRQYNLIELYFARLTLELPKIAHDEQWSNTLCEVGFQTGTDVGALWNPQSTLELTDIKTLVYLNMELKPNRPDLYSDELDLFFAEMGEARLADVWESDRGSRPLIF